MEEKAKGEKENEVKRRAGNWHTVKKLENKTKHFLPDIETEQDIKLPWQKKYLDSVANRRLYWLVVYFCAAYFCVTI